jgi:hypothetical protein
MIFSVISVLSVVKSLSACPSYTERGHKLRF